MCLIQGSRGCAALKKIPVVVEERELILNVAQVAPLGTDRKCLCICPGLKETLIKQNTRHIIISLGSIIDLHLM